MMLLLSPQLAIDMSLCSRRRTCSSAMDKDYVFCVESEFFMHDVVRSCAASSCCCRIRFAQAILRAVRVA